MKPNMATVRANIICPYEKRLGPPREQMLFAPTEVGIIASL